MSRIGKKPVEIPSDVKVSLSGKSLAIEGAKGKLNLDVHPRVEVSVNDNKVEVSRNTDINTDRALHGLTRSLINNMIEGVSKGFEKTLDIEGVGYKAQLKGKVLNLALGYSHEINYDIPEGLEIKCPNQTQIVISGADKQKVGQAAAEIRRFHKPEPYKGKGIRYSDEKVRRKQGKKVG